jgi:hypothetical protein
MAIGAPAAIAQTDDYDKFSLSLGVFFTDRESDTRFDTALGVPGDNVDLENQLGLDKSDSVFRIDGYYRFANKHQINFSAFDLSRTATVQIQEEINWNGTIFLIDTEINSDFDMTIYKVDYTWRFMQRDKGYLGLTGGLYIADFQMRLESSITNQLATDGTTAPLPVLGLRGEYDFSEKWSFRADAEVFAFEYGDFDGSLYDIYAGVDYGFSEHMAIGLGINSARMDLGVAKTNFAGDLDWQYEGALLYLKFSF